MKVVCPIMSKNFPFNKTKQYTKKQLEATRSRNWCATLKCASFTREQIEEGLAEYSYLGQMEEGSQNGYKHWQIVIEHRNAIKGRTLLNKFPGGHFEPRESKSALPARSYVLKLSTRVPDQPPLVGGKFLEMDLADLIDTDDDETLKIRNLVMNEGLTSNQVLLKHPELLHRHRDVDRMYQAQQSRVGRGYRKDLEVHYLYGLPGVGKTHMVYDSVDDMDTIYRVSDYEHPFDEYSGEPVLLLDEFSGQMKFETFLQAIDIYPTRLSARYHNKRANWHVVWLVSNLSLKKLPWYSDSKVSKAQWNALCRRITSYRRMESDRTFTDLELPAYSLAEVLAEDSDLAAR